MSEIDRLQSDIWCLKSDISAKAEKRDVIELTRKVTSLRSEVIFLGEKLDRALDSLGALEAGFKKAEERRAT